MTMCGVCDKCGLQMEDAGAIGCYCPDVNCKLTREELISISGDLFKPKFTEEQVIDKLFGLHRNVAIVIGGRIVLHNTEEVLEKLNGV